MFLQTVWEIELKRVIIGQLIVQPFLLQVQARIYLCHQIYNDKVLNRISKLNKNKNYYPTKLNKEIRIMIK